MHQTQKKLLDLAKAVTINIKNPRVVGKLVEVENPQNVVHHLRQLEKLGFISINDKTGVVTVQQQKTEALEGLLKLPIFGTANCGPATILAQENLRGYLAVPRATIGKKRREDLFLVEAVGDSMNAAQKIKGGPIKSGDFVIINKSNVSPDNGEYVLSIIDGMANIKRFYRDDKNHRIRLESESTMETKPIYIREEDAVDYMVNGVVLGVIKK